MAIDPRTVKTSARALSQLTVYDRYQLAQSSYGQEMMAALTPAERDKLFPRYYRDKLSPSLFGATSGGTPITKDDYVSPGGAGYTPPSTTPAPSPGLKPGWYKTFMGETGGDVTGVTLPSAPAVPGKGNPLSNQRQSASAQLTQEQKIHMYALTMAEVGRDNPAAQRALMETIYNRYTAQRKSSLAATMGADYYEPLRTYTKGYQNYLKARADLQRNPDLFKQMDSRHNEVLAGSNDSNYATHNGSAGVAAGARRSQTIGNVLGGETFSRKDNPAYANLHGAGTVKAEGDWYRNTMKEMQAFQAGTAQPEKDLLAIPKQDPNQTGALVPPGGLKPKTTPDAAGTTSGDIKQNEPPPRVVGGRPAGLHPAIGDSMTEASKYLPEGYSIRFNNAARTSSTVGSKSYHLMRDENGNALAVDVEIIDPNGNVLKNIRSPENFGIYRDFMQNTKKIMVDRHPEMAGKGRWGGYFVSGVSQDLMHFDLGPEMQTAAGNWLTGLKPEFAQYGRPEDINKGMGSFENYTMGGKITPAQIVGPPPPGFETLPDEVKNFVGSLPASEQEGFYKRLQSPGMNAAKLAEIYNADPDVQKSKQAAQEKAKGIVNAVSQSTPPKSFSSAEDQQKYYDGLYQKASAFSGVAYGSKSQHLCGKGARGLVGGLLSDQYFAGGLGTGTGNSALPKEHAGSLSGGNRYLQDSGYYNEGKSVQPDQVLSQDYLKSLPIGTVVSSQGKGPGHVQVKVGPNEWASDFKQGNRVLGGYNNYVVHTPNQTGLQKLDPRIANDPDTLAYAQNQGYTLNPDQQQEVKAAQMVAPVKPVTEDQQGQTGALTTQGGLQPKTQEQAVNPQITVQPPTQVTVQSTPPSQQSTAQATATPAPQITPAPPPQQTASPTIAASTTEKKVEVPVSAYGRQVRPEGQTVAIKPIGGDLKGDNKIIVDKRGPVSTFNDQKENVTQDPRTGAVDIRPTTRTNPRDIERNTENKQQSIESASDQRMAQSGVGNTYQRSPHEENVRNPNHQEMVAALATQTEVPASFQRAMSRATRFHESGRAADFSFNQANFKTA